MMNRSITICLLLLFEAVANTVIIFKVPFTEIDYKTYIQQVDQIWKGERDYSKVYGNSGPLVYPAGFVYIFGVLNYLELPLVIVQFIFAVLQMITVFIVFKIYSKSKYNVPLVFLTLSKRIHSIYVLRCFNDPVAMFFLYSSVLALLNDKYKVSSILFSVALSVKMNVLLFFPGFAIIHWICTGAYKTIKNISLIILVQCILAAPYADYSYSYLASAFNFSRQFEYKWTVNWRMVPAEAFYSPAFSYLLLLLHASLLLIFIQRWCRFTGGIWNTFSTGFTTIKTLSNDEKIFIMFTANLVGITCARSLHYQFYVWYFHSLPYLLWRCDFNLILGTRLKWLNHTTRIAMLLMIEYSWNVFPSTSLSSMNLFIHHSFLIYALLKTKKLKIN